MVAQLPPLSRHERKESSSLQRLDAEHSFPGSAIAEHFKAAQQIAAQTNTSVVCNQQLHALEEEDKTVKENNLEVLRKQTKRALDDEEYDVAKDLKIELEAAQMICRSDLNPASIRPDVHRAFVHQCIMSVQILSRIAEHIHVATMPCFRAASKLLRGVLEVRLSCDANIRAALDSHTRAMAMQIVSRPRVPLASHRKGKNTARHQRVAQSAPFADSAREPQVAQPAAASPTVVKAQLCALNVRKQLCAVECADKAKREQGVEELGKRIKSALENEEYDLAKDLKFQFEVARKVVKPPERSKPKSCRPGLQRLSSRPDVHRAVVCECVMSVRILARIIQYISVRGMPSFRVVNKVWKGVLEARLSGSLKIRTELDNHTMALAKQITRQPWVAVRVKPGPSHDVHVGGRSVSINTPETPNAPRAQQHEDYFFDEVFEGPTSQLDVWGCLETPLMQCVVAQLHACILAYGQTGSGKTYTMFGDATNGEGVAFRTVRRIAGMLRRTLARDLRMKQTFSAEFSFLEIYNECIFDLLDGQRQLQCTRESTGAAVPQGTTKWRCPADKIEDSMIKWLEAGASSRSVGETFFNPASSRSHAVATIYLNWRPGVQSRIYLVDLAGSERAGKYAISEEQLREGNSINHGLTTLGRVVSVTATSRGDHVPVRDSALTWLLSDAITAQDGRAFMFAAVNPTSLPETISTLRYAKQFSTLQARSGVDLARWGKALRSLKVQVSMLQFEFQDLANKGRAQDKVWTQAMLRMGGVRIIADVRSLVEAHPLLEWTHLHEQISTNDLGCILQMADSPLLRSESDPPDGRVTAPPMQLLKLLPRRIVATPRSAKKAVAEVVFEGMRHKKPVVVWYPEAALECVKPPRWLEPLVSLARKIASAEDKLKRVRAAMLAAQARHAQDHKRLVDYAQPPQAESLLAF